MRADLSPCRAGSPGLPSARSLLSIDVLRLFSPFVPQPQCACPPLATPAQVFLNVSDGTGLNTIYTGVFDQDTYIFAGNYLDGTGYAFGEVFQINSDKKCTNWEVHGTACNLGCNDGVKCGGHSCSCGGAMGIFEYLSAAVVSGTCGPAGVGTLYVSHVEVTDDDNARSQRVEYCFVDDTPLSIFKQYLSGGAGGDALTPFVKEDGDMDEDLGAPEHSHIMGIHILFNSWAPMQANPKAFKQPAGCGC